MQAGSLVECIRECEPDGEKNPVKGQIYTCEIILPCPCGKHNLVGLVEFPRVYYYAEDFREVQPPLSIQDIFTEPETKPIVRELEPA